MKLVATCKSCKEEITIKSKAITRPDLIAEKNETFRLQCQECAIEKEYHVNDVDAKSSNTMKTIGLIVGLSVLVITTLVFFLMGYISTIGIVIGIMIIGASFGTSSSSSNVKAFNSYKITRT